MNKGDIRTRVLEQVDWNPSQSADFKNKVDRLINRAYQTLSLQAPFLFFEEEARIITQVDVTSDASDSLDVLRVNSTDSYVLERTYFSNSATTPQAWQADGTWDGRHLEVTKSDGTVVRRQIREIWTTETPAGGITTYVTRLTIDRPWPNTTDTGMTYRVFTPEYDLPADVVELRSARLWDSTHYALSVQTQAEMERFEYVDYQGEETGRPTNIFRGRHKQIDAPTEAPGVVVHRSSAGWEGPEPAGKFDYCYTYVWGNRPADLLAPSGNYEPRWESAPSPISAQIEHSGSPTQTINIATPNIDQQLNFYAEHDGNQVVFPVRTQRSGLRKRIYIRRYSQIGIQGITTPVPIETGEIFYLLTEIPGHQTSYHHNGSVIPDYFRRLKTTHGYQSIRFWPMPDDDYELDLRILRRPQPLIADTDAPRIHPEAIDALIEKVLCLFYEMNGQLDVSQLAEARYQNFLLTLTKRYGRITAMRPKKRFARVTRPYREVRVRYKP